MNHFENGRAKAKLDIENKLGILNATMIDDPKGKAMVRYKGKNYLLTTDRGTAKTYIEQNNPISMWKDFSVIDWV